MIQTQFTLITKNTLTHDVYELVYVCDALTQNVPKPGQYMMFQLAPGLNRSYSIASILGNTFTLIIKKIPEGRWSCIICDAVVGTTFSGIIPLGHFTLRNTAGSKCFIGTGTGFAPLYFQLRASLEWWCIENPTAFIFWVREFRDVFYTDAIETLHRAFPHFQSQIYLSRELQQWCIMGYVTDWITPENIEQYEEFYLCGSLIMVKSAREKLEALGIMSTSIFWEQY